MNLKLDLREEIRRIRNLMADKALVLMYHRIADINSDPWQLAVSPCNFEQQLQVLKKKYKLISVKDLVSALNKKNIEPNTICITFDDGYSDNYFAAKPLLEKYECPATFFVSTHYINQQQPFWWDELEEIILNSKNLPPTFSLNFDKELFIFRLGSDSVLTEKQHAEQKNWVWGNRPPNRRCKLYLTIWERLKALPYNEIQALIKKIKGWASYVELAKGTFPMTDQQLNDVAKQPLFDIGLHTATHPVLSHHRRDVQFSEIAENERSLKDNCGDIIRALSYPFGSFNKETISVVKEHRLNAAFTTKEQSITNSSDLYRLGRFQVKNWRADELEKRLSDWIK